VELVSREAMSSQVDAYNTIAGMIQMPLLMGSTCGTHSAFPYPLFLCLRVEGRPVATPTGPETRES